MHLPAGRLVSKIHESHELKLRNEIEQFKTELLTVKKGTQQTHTHKR